MNDRLNSMLTAAIFGSLGVLRIFRNYNKTSLGEQVGIEQEVDHFSFFFARQSGFYQGFRLVKAYWRLQFGITAMKKQIIGDVNAERLNLLPKSWMLLSQKF